MFTICRLMFIILMGVAHASDNERGLGHIASIYISETFLNQQLAEHFADSELIKKIAFEFDRDQQIIFLKGRLQLPIDDLKAKGLDPNLMQFNFKLSIQPKLVDKEYLVLEFPLSQTYFYPANSQNPERDRVIIPVQLLSLGVASIRGYLSALSGDFTSFERKDKKLNALLVGVERNLAIEKNQDALKYLRREKKSLELQIAANLLEKEKFTETSMALSRILGSDDSQEQGPRINLNEEIKARDNAIMLRMNVKNIVPYLKDIELGKIRIGQNTKDDHKESYLIFYLKTNMLNPPEVTMKVPHTSISKFTTPPAIAIRLNQILLTSDIFSKKDEQQLSENNIRDFHITFQDDGVHLKGKVRKFIFTIPFDALVDFVSTEPDEFLVKIRNIEVFMFDLKFLSPIALRILRNRLNKVFEGLCQFQYIGKKDNASALKVRVDSAKLIPAFPGMHLVDVRVRDGNFMFRMGYL